MDEKILKYRQIHKKCKYCKYLKYDSSSERIGVPGFYVCKVKDKIIRGGIPDMTNIPRWFCQCYEVQEDDSRE